MFFKNSEIERSSPTFEYFIKSLLIEIIFSLFLLPEEIFITSVRSNSLTKMLKVVREGRNICHPL